MSANGRWDLTRQLKGKMHVYIIPLLTDRLSAICRVVIRRFFLTREFTAAVDS
jgi:hypothetical protein